MLNGSTQPYFSVVVTSRNDDHGGDMLGRMNIFARTLLEQLAWYRLPSELIFVEWNPPANRPRLRDALTWPEDRYPCEVRFIEVPPEVHATHRHSQALPLFQMIAKNVGVRRARGEFVLATNIDILFSDALVRHIAARRLRRGRMYRMDRHDIRETVPANGDLLARLAFCEDRRNLLRICERGGTRDPRTGKVDVIFPNHLELWARKTVAQIFPDEIRRRYDMTPDHAEQFYRFHRAIGRLHTNACGDFTMMAREDWARMRGYAEWEMYSFHLDSLFCHAAHAAGIREKRLGGLKKIFHIEHSAGSGFTPENQDKLWNRLEVEKIARMTDQELWDEVIAIRSGRKDGVYNGPEWGLADRDLPEIVLD
jgi:hypothetical protein